MDDLSIYDWDKLLLWVISGSSIFMLIALGVRRSLRPSLDKIPFPSFVEILLFFVTVLSFLQMLYSGILGHPLEQDSPRRDLIQYSLDTTQRFCQPIGSKDLPSTCNEIRTFQSKMSEVSRDTQLDLVTKLISHIEALRYDDQEHLASPDFIFAVKSSLLAELRDFRDTLQSPEVNLYLWTVALSAFVAVLFGARLAFLGWFFFPLAGWQLRRAWRSFFSRS